MRYELKNEKLILCMESLGAEMVSLKDNQTGQEYLWNGDEKYWKRSSPILFPCVGSMKNKEYIYKDNKYSMPQHGFARDMEFTCISENADEIWFSVNANPETRACYPFEFGLKIGYRLTDNQVVVMWKVTNGGKKKMHFSIGGHPAFLCPLKDGERQDEYSIWLDTKSDGVLYSKVNENALMYNTRNELRLHNGRYVLKKGFFDEGAYIIEDYQVQKVALVDPDNNPYITVAFAAPVVGIWSPEKKDAPFVCIEPWYGRCDRETFEGTLKEREWGNKLKSGEVFERSYTITVG